MMVDDSTKALQVKEQVRRGEMNRFEFARIMDDLRRTGRDRLESRKPARGASASAAVVTAGLAISAATSSSTATERWEGRDSVVGAGARGGDRGKDQEIGLPPGLKRPVSSSGMLSKLGGRIVAGLKIDQANTSGQVVSSPQADGVRSAGGGRDRRKSPRRGFGSPRQQTGANEASSGTVSWRPWSAPGTNTRNLRRLVPGPSSPERPGPSPGDTPVRGNRGADARQSPGQLQGHAENGGSGGGVRGRAGSAGSTGAPVPLTASEIDNMSSISNTSTVLTDLSLRLEKIEDMLSRLLDAHRPTRRSSDGGGGGDQVNSCVGSESSRDSGGGSRGRGRNERDGTGEISQDRLHANEDYADELSGMVGDTAGELREVRGRLRQLEVEEAARAAAAAVATAPASSTSGALPAPSLAAPAFPQQLVEGKTAPPGSEGAVDSGGGLNRLPRGAPASELPEDDEDELITGESSAFSAVQSAEQGGESPIAAIVPAVSEELGGERNAESKHDRGGAEGEGWGAGGGLDEVKGDEPDDPPGDRAPGGILRRLRPSGLSTITEAST